MKEHVWTLPPRLGGEIELPAGTRRLIIVGANGAGKSRFADRLTRDMGQDAFGVSALRAIYGREAESATAVDREYLRRAEHSPIMRPDIHGGFERLMALLLEEETADMFRRRYSPDRRQPGSTRLQRLARLWNDIFPDNNILLETGALLFSNDRGESTYTPKRLSDGEKAVIYYLGAALLAPANAVLVVDTPGMFLHAATIGPVWDAVEGIRPHGATVYVTHDLDFAAQRASRPATATIWVRRYDAAAHMWDYEILPPEAGISEDVILAVMGSRKPVLFIEGDDTHSLDSKLYPLVFQDYTVRSLGSCNRVVEATRTFNDLRALHNLAATGIVDRDRRNEHEVEYLRRKNVMVPRVAEVENLFMLEDVIRAVARTNGRDPSKAFNRVKGLLLTMFSREIEQQALQHTRHRVKIETEHTVDRRFRDIDELERHLRQLEHQISPRRLYEHTLAHFRQILEQEDYAEVLKVYNRKSMLSETEVARHTGVRPADKTAYIETVLALLRRGGSTARELSDAIRRAVI